MGMMDKNVLNQLSSLLSRHSFVLYPNSVRNLAEDIYVFVAKGNADKKVGILSKGKALGFRAPFFSEDIKVEATGFSFNLYPLSFENYLILRDEFGIAPVPCKNKASFGTGDRLGLATSAHLDAFKGYDLFPVLAQQSPRELEKTHRDFRDVLLKAVLGVLEAGYTGGFGADADHIKDERYLLEAADAGYTMYTLDVSEMLVKGDVSPEDHLSQHSRDIIKDFSGKRISFEGGEYTVKEEELYRSAVIYEKAMNFVERVHGLLKERLRGFDLEVSIDEGDRDTTVEDHIFVAEYLHRRGIDFWSLAPKFPGEFEKAVDYRGDIDKFALELNKHCAVARMLGGYRLSLHSGSDKFSVYRIFNDATQHNFHIKTSGTSWLQALNVIHEKDRQLFKELYRIALDNLEESKKAYKISICRQDFDEGLDLDNPQVLQNPKIKQLLHISYGVLLDEKKQEIYDVLNRHEAQHYRYVADNIKKHLELLK
ncbi:MAG: tagaturonate epimerase [Clostridiales bacterium]|nr:tagaturonate epimerase [Clostridiales bacterium]